MLWDGWFRKVGCSKMRRKTFLSSPYLCERYKRLFKITFVARRYRNSKIAPEVQSGEIPPRATIPSDGRQVDVTFSHVEQLP